jgi:hypothetical protein
MVNRGKVAMLAATTLKTIQWSFIVWAGLSIGGVSWMVRLLFHRPKSLPVRSDILGSIAFAAVTISLLLAFHASSATLECLGALCLGWIIEAMLRLCGPKMQVRVTSEQGRKR